MFDKDGTSRRAAIAPAGDGRGRGEARPSPAFVAHSGVILGVSSQRVSQMVAEREDFPQPAKVIGRHRCGDSRDVERWRDTKPRAWLPEGQ
jgi:hypothetical protein